MLSFFGADSSEGPDSGTWNGVLNWLSSALPDLSDSQSISPPTALQSGFPTSPSPKPLSLSRKSTLTSPSPASTSAHQPQTIGETFLGLVAEMFALDDPLDATDHPTERHDLSPTPHLRRTADVPTTPIAERPAAPSALPNREALIAIVAAARAVTAEMNSLADAAGVALVPTHSQSIGGAAAAAAADDIDDVASPAALSDDASLCPPPSALHSPPSSPQALSPTPATHHIPPPTTPDLSRSRGADSPTSPTSPPFAQHVPRSPIVFGPRSPIMLRAPRFTRVSDADALRRVTRRWLCVCGELAGFVTVLSAAAHRGDQTNDDIIGDVRTALFAGAAAFRRIAELSDDAAGP